MQIMKMSERGRDVIPVEIHRALGLHEVCIRPDAS